MIVLVDTDILLDVVLDRSQFAQDSSALLTVLEHKAAQGYIAWHSISNLYYLVRPRRGKSDTLTMISRLLEFLDVAPCATSDLQFAVSLPMADFEDAMQAAAAVAVGADFIATRNGRDFKGSPVKPAAPTVLLRTLAV